MPTENLTPVQQRQREEYTERLAEAQLRLRIKSSNMGGPDIRRYRDNELGQPWDIAAGMVDGLRRSRTARSSVRNILRNFCVVSLSALIGLGSQRGFQSKHHHVNCMLK